MENHVFETSPYDKNTMVVVSTYSSALCTSYGKTNRIITGSIEFELYENVLKGMVNKVREIACTGPFKKEVSDHRRLANSFTWVPPNAMTGAKANRASIAYGGVDGISQIDFNYDGSFNQHSISIKNNSGRVDSIKSLAWNGLDTARLAVATDRFRKGGGLLILDMNNRGKTERLIQNGVKRFRRGSGSAVAAMSWAPNHPDILLTCEKDSVVIYDIRQQSSYPVINHDNSASSSIVANTVFYNQSYPTQTTNTNTNTNITTGAATNVTATTINYSNDNNNSIIATPMISPTNKYYRRNILSSNTNSNSMNTNTDDAAAIDTTSYYNGIRFAPFNSNVFATYTNDTIKLCDMRRLTDLIGSSGGRKGTGGNANFISYNTNSNNGEVNIRFHYVNSLAASVIDIENVKTDKSNCNNTGVYNNARNSNYISLEVSSDFIEDGNSNNIISTTKDVNNNDDNNDNVSINKVEWSPTDSSLLAVSCYSKPFEILIFDTSSKNSYTNCTLTSSSGVGGRSVDGDVKSHRHRPIYRLHTKNKIESFLWTNTSRILSPTSSSTDGNSMGANTTITINDRLLCYTSLPRDSGVDSGNNNKNNSIKNNYNNNNNNNLVVARNIHMMENLPIRPNFVSDFHPSSYRLVHLSNTCTEEKYKSISQYESRGENSRSSSIVEPILDISEIMFRRAVLGYSMDAGRNRLILYNECNTKNCYDSNESSGNYHYSNSDIINDTLPPNWSQSLFDFWDWLIRMFLVESLHNQGVVISNNNNNNVMNINHAGSHHHSSSGGGGMKNRVGGVVNYNSNVDTQTLLYTGLVSSTQRVMDGNEADSVTFKNSLGASLYIGSWRQAALLLCGWSDHSIGCPSLGAKTKEYRADGNNTDSNDNSKLYNNHYHLSSSSLEMGSDRISLDGKLDQLLLNLEQLGQHERAVAVAIFHGSISKAIQLLTSYSETIQEKRRMKEENSDEISSIYTTVAACISGFTSKYDSKGVRMCIDTSMWDDHCRRILDSMSSDSNVVPMPYLTAALVFLLETHCIADSEEANYYEIFMNADLALNDRLGFVLRYVPIASLKSFVESELERHKENGDIIGLLVSGFNKDGYEILKRYLDVTGDIQTTAIISQYIPSECLNESQQSWVLYWLENYRDMLNYRSMWHVRAKFDIECAKRSNNSIHKSKLNQPTIYVRCQFCKNALNVKAVLESENNRFFKKVSKLSSQIGSCYHCQRLLPKCSVCLLKINTVNPDLLRKYEIHKNRTASKSTNNNINNNISSINRRSTNSSPLKSQEKGINFQFNFENAWTWCQTCRHGGHAKHLADWFKNHKQCPVSGCVCECNSLDTMNRVQIASELNYYNDDDYNKNGNLKDPIARELLKLKSTEVNSTPVKRSKN